MTEPPANTARYTDTTNPILSLTADKLANPSRRRMSLNLATVDYVPINAIAQFERCSVTEAIRSSTRWRWRMIANQYPDLRWPDMPRDLLPAPRRLAWIDTATGDTQIIELA